MKPKNYKFTLIGMSQTGKTFWSKRIQNQGYKYMHYQDFIESKLEEELKKDGFSSIEEAVEWMKKPYAIQYKKIVNMYVELEEMALKNIIKDLKKLKDDERVVVDTTGSIIDINPELLKELESLTTVIFLDVPDSVQRKMLGVYLEYPKPVYWGKEFERNLDETYEKALKKHYSKIVKQRKSQYREHADIILNYYLLRSKNFSADNFINIASGNF